VKYDKGGKVLRGSPYYDTVLDKIINPSDKVYNPESYSAIPVSEMEKFKANRDNRMQPKDILNPNNDKTKLLGNDNKERELDILSPNKTSDLENVGGLSPNDNTRELDRKGSSFENTGNRQNQDIANKVNYGTGLDHTTAQYVTAIGTSAANFGYVPQRKNVKRNVFISDIEKKAYNSLQNKMNQQFADQRSRTPKTSDATLNTLSQQATTENAYQQNLSLAQSEAQDINRQKDLQYGQRMQADAQRVAELNQSIAIDNAEALAKDKAKDMFRTTVAQTTMDYADTKKLEKEQQRQLAENLFISKQNQEIEKQISELSNKKAKLLGPATQRDRINYALSIGQIDDAQVQIAAKNAIDQFNTLYPEDKVSDFASLDSALTQKINDLDTEMGNLREAANNNALEIRAKGALVQGYQYAPTSNQYGHLNNSSTGQQFNPNNPIGKQLFKKGGKTKSDYQFEAYKHELRKEAARSKEEMKYDNAAKIEQLKISMKIAENNIRNFTKSIEAYNKDIHNIYNKGKNK